MALCELCSRDRPLTEHHLIPRTLHSNKWFQKNFTREEMKTGLLPLCVDCHRAIHDFFDEKTLGREFNTKDKLLSHPKVQNFIKWIYRKR